MFERMLLRRICGPIFENGEWRKQYNKELYEILQEINFIDIYYIIGLRKIGKERGNSYRKNEKIFG